MTSLEFPYSTGECPYQYRHRPPGPDEDRGVCQLCGAPSYAGRPFGGAGH